MKQATLSLWLRAMITLVLAMVLMVYFWLAKVFVDFIENGAPGPDMFDGWCLMMLATIAPVIAAAWFAWRIAKNIGKDRSFTIENANHLKTIAVLAAIDAAIFLIGFAINIVIEMPAILGLIEIFAVIIASAVSCVGAGLSHLTHKAAIMQQENELTI